MKKELNFQGFSWGYTESVNGIEDILGFTIHFE